MKKIRILFVFILFYIYKDIFQYTHPIENTKYNFFFLSTFGIGFLPYLISEKFGRILTILTAISLTRLLPILGISDNFICNFPIFFGAITGVLFKNKNKLEYSNILILILFLNFLLIERFFVYFNFPYLNGYSLQETFYNSEILSKTAYAISVEIIYSIYFPLFWIYLDNEKNKKDYLIGIFFLILINLPILSIQKFISPNFLMEQTNLSLEVGRQPALLRDSSSSSVILSISFFLILLNIKTILPIIDFSNQWIKKNKFIFIILIIYFIYYFLIIFTTQGRTSLLILFFGMLISLLKYKNYISKKFKIYSTIFIIISFCFLIYKLDKPEIRNKFQYQKIENIETFLKSVDPPRFYLNLISLELFLEKPFFGNGIGSFIPELKDTTREKTNPFKLIDNPGSFYSGILFEIGIFGTIFLVLNLGKKLIRVEIFLLMFTFLIGYHLVHPDVAFFCIILFFGLGHEEKKNNYKLYLSNLIFFLFLIQLLYNFYCRENLFEFRKKQTLNYQLNNYSETNNHFIFKGNLIWKTENKNKFNLEFCLDNSTKRENANFKINFLNIEKKIIHQESLLIKKEENQKIEINLKDIANSIEIFERDRFRDFTPILIPKKYFNQRNEFILGE